MLESEWLQSKGMLRRSRPRYHGSLRSSTTAVWSLQSPHTSKNDLYSFVFLLSYLHTWSRIKGAFDWEIRSLNPDFPIEHEIRKRISSPRNPSSGWISIKKSKSGFHGFPFYRSIGKSEKGFAKLFSWTAVLFLLIMRARTRPLFGFLNGTVKIQKTDISALKSVFEFRVRLQIRNPDFKI